MDSSRWWRFRYLVFFCQRLTHLIHIRSDCCISLMINNTLLSGKPSYCTIFTACYLPEHHHLTCQTHTQKIINFQDLSLSLSLTIYLFYPLPRYHISESSSYNSKILSSVVIFNCFLPLSLNSLRKPLTVWRSISPYPRFLLLFCAQSTRSVVVVEQASNSSSPFKQHVEIFTIQDQ